MLRLPRALFSPFVSIVLGILIIGQPVYTGMTFAQGPPQKISTPSGKIIIPRSSVEDPADADIRAHTNHLIFVADQPQAAGAGPAGENPSSLACVYNIVNPALNPGCLTNPTSGVFTNPVGGSGVIAIVDAFDYPTAYSDLSTFSTQFGLLPTLTNCTGAALGPNCFQVVYATGVRPSTDCGWNQEAALDIEWAHAMAPGASIVLVEAATNSNADLLVAVDKATSIVQGAGGGQISMSWGGSESRRESSSDSHFDAAGVAYFASSGDVGGKTIWPGVSQNVVSAGGTRVNRDSAGNFSSESAWSKEICGGGPCGGGGGPSRYESRPLYQNVISGIVGSSRGTPDFSFDADPQTGVAVYENSTACTGTNAGWLVFGGTSVSSPALAGIVNLADTAGHHLSTGRLNGYQEQILLYTGYPNYSESTFRDITTGNTGFAAKTGWDFATGIGSDQGLNSK
jgi:kumamolisin